jgi:hypothetical protein
MNFTLAMPPDWLVLQLGDNDHTVAPLPDSWPKELHQACAVQLAQLERAAVEAGVLVTASLTLPLLSEAGTLAGLVAASMVVAYVADTRSTMAHTAADAGLGARGTVRWADRGLRPAGDGTPPIPEHRVHYVVPRPAGRAGALLRFASPNVALAPELDGLFDGIAGSFAWVD